MNKIDFDKHDFSLSKWPRDELDRRTLEAQQDYDDLRAVPPEELERLAIQNAPLMQNHIPVADESMRNAIRNYGRVPEADWNEDSEHSDYDDSGLDLASTGAFAAHREAQERFTLGRHGYGWVALVVLVVVAVVAYGLPAVMQWWVQIGATFNEKAR